MIGVRAAIDTAAKRLEAAGIPSPSWEARFLLCDCEGLTPTEIVMEPTRLLTDPGRYEAWIARRATGEPASRITGRRAFRDLEFRVGPATLDPRVDSEILVDAVLAHIPDGGAPRLGDIGTGTGCLLLSVLHERPQAKGIGTDISTDALAIARANAADHDLAERARFVQGAWCAPYGDGSVDLLMSNPPYIRRSEIPGLDPSVRDYDPHIALDGGPDGLDAYRAIVADSARVLRPNGRLFLEIGWDQGETVPALLTAGGFDGIRVLKDSGDRDRVVHGHLNHRR